MSINYTDPDLVQEVYMKNHEIASHTYSHVMNPGEERQAEKAGYKGKKQAACQRGSSSRTWELSGCRHMCQSLAVMLATRQLVELY